MGRPMSLLDTDFYKFTTGYAVMMKFPLAEAVFEFTDRNKVPRTDEFLEEFKRELKKMEQMDMSPEEFNWLCEMPSMPFRAQVRVRHTKWEMPFCTVEAVGDLLKIICDTPVRAPAPGQSAVLYDGNRVLGGGFII